MVTRINSCARNAQSLLFDLINAFYYIESSHKSDILYPKRQIFLHAWAACSELPSNISDMVITKVPTDRI